MLSKVTEVKEKTFSPAPHLKFTSPLLFRITGSFKSSRSEDPACAKSPVQMPNQKWDDVTVASFLVHLVRYMGMPSIDWIHFGEQFGISGYKLKYVSLLRGCIRYANRRLSRTFTQTVIIGGYQREMRYQDRFGKLRRALLSCDLENDSASENSGQDGEDHERIHWRRMSSTVTASHRVASSLKKRKRRRTGADKDMSYRSWNRTHDQTAAPSATPDAEKRRSNGRHDNRTNKARAPQYHTRLSHQTACNSRNYEATSDAIYVPCNEQRRRSMSTSSTYTIGRPIHLSDSNSTPISPRRNFGQAGNHADPSKLRRPTQPIAIMRPRRGQKAPRTNVRDSSSATSSSLSSPIMISSDEEDDIDSDNNGYGTEDEEVMHIPMRYFRTIVEELPDIRSISRTKIVLDEESKGRGLQTTNHCRIRGDWIGRKIARDEIRRKFQQADNKDRKGKGRALS